MIMVISLAIISGCNLGTIAVSLYYGRRINRALARIKAANERIVGQR